MADDLARLTRLLASLAAGQSDVPTSSFGRLRRTAGTALRLGAGALKGKLTGQSTFDLDAVERAVASLGELKGLAMKMGQIMSYVDGSIPEEARRMLAVLQVHSQPTPFEAIEGIVRADLGPRAGELLERMERVPLATASIGQVHRSWLQGQEVAVKVRHPGIDEAIRADFKVAQTGKLIAQLVAPGANVPEALAEAQARFLEECDYVRERGWQERFGALYQGDGAVVIPRVLGDFCGARVLTTAFHHGRSFDEVVAQASQEERDGLGRALYRFYLGSLYRHGLFNADPHPGNLLFPASGGVVVLDFGCVREFEPATVAAVAALSRAVRADDEAQMRRALESLGAAPPRAGSSFATTRGLLRAFFQPVLVKGAHRLEADLLHEAQEIFRTKIQVAELRLPGRLLFLFRIRFGLRAVLSRLGACVDWRALEDELAGEG